MKKVLILLCGGTIIMKKNVDGTLSPPRNKNEIKEIMENIEPSISKIANCDYFFVCDIDSTNITPEIWDILIKIIKKEYKNYDGFLIIHGTDTMAYTSSALSISIKNLGKPVVLTGSQIPGTQIESDAKRNFVNGVRLCTMDISGVYILFDERIISGGRATKASESKLDAFTSVNSEDAGEVSIKINLKSWVPERNNKLKPAFLPGFEPDIFLYTLTPGADPEDFVFLFKNKKIKGILMMAFGTGNVPQRFKEVFKEAKKMEIPIVVTSQCLYGKTFMDIYEVGNYALKLGAIEGFDQSTETLTVKLMWALKHFSNSKNKIEKIKNYIQRNICGEINRDY